MPVCPQCGETFQSSNSRKLYCSYSCRRKTHRTQASPEYHQAYRERTRDRRRELSAKRTAANRKWVDDYKVSKGCIDCGYNAHPVALELDHVTGLKEMEVSKMMELSLERIQAEISKCVVRCANCHRVRHYEARQRGKGFGPAPLDD